MIALDGGDRLFTLRCGLMPDLPTRLEEPARLGALPAGCDSSLLMAKAVWSPTFSESNLVLVEQQTFASESEWGA